VTWVLDLDGVVWLADQPIPGSAEAIRAARQGGRRILFVTNNSSLTVGEYLDKLEQMGVPTQACDLVTSAQAAASLLAPGSSALACAGPGVVEALRAAGVEVRDDGPVDAVVVGWHRDFDFDRLTGACRAIWGGARLVATNSDATYPVPGGLLPGAGAILASVQVATAAEAEVAGKPHPPVVDLLRQRAPDVDLVVGDRLDTDGLLARRLGVDFGLVLTGVTQAAPPPSRDSPALVAADLARLLDLREQ
jgi:HAD superfamily hydrolase (TIGR01450 family)